MSVQAHHEPLYSGANEGGSTRKLHLSTSGADRPGNAVIHDLSETGLLVQTSAPFSIGEVIEVALPDAGPAAARVVWASNDFFGCRFEDPVTSAAVSFFRARRGSQPVTVPSLEGPSPAQDGQHFETFGARLRRLRKERNISLVGLARLVNVSKPSLWKWETDATRPRQQSLEALASALDVTEQELIFGAKVSAQPDNEVSDQQARPQASQQNAAPLRDLVAECKRRIAEAAGISPDAISLTIRV